MDNEQAEIIDPAEEPEQLKCFGPACQNCKSFFYCPMRGDGGE